jgi:hypothetical protein
LFEENTPALYSIGIINVEEESLRMGLPSSVVVFDVCAGRLEPAASKINKSAILVFMTI